MCEPTFELRLEFRLPSGETFVFRVDDLKSMARDITPSFFEPCSLARQFVIQAHFEPIEETTITIVCRDLVPESHSPPEVCGDNNEDPDSP